MSRQVYKTAPQGAVFVCVLKFLHPGAQVPERKRLVWLKRPCVLIVKRCCMSTKTDSLPGAGIAAEAPKVPPPGAPTQKPGVPSTSTGWGSGGAKPSSSKGWG